MILYNVHISHKFHLKKPENKKANTLILFIANIVVFIIWSLIMSVTAMDLVATAKQTISVCDIETAKSALSSHLILDVREPAEYAVGFLPGAINIPRGVLEFKINAHPAFQGKQNANIIVYCLTGGRSALAVEALNKLGYNNAISMDGGFTSWKENGLEVAFSPESCQN